MIEPPAAAVTRNFGSDAPIQAPPTFSGMYFGKTPRRRRATTKIQTSTPELIGFDKLQRPQ